MNERAAVSNAADVKQVKHAGRKDQERRQLEIAALREILKLPAGRLVLWNVLTHCKVFESIWHPSALIHANAGRQDVGHWLLAEIAEADEDVIVLMMREARVAKKRDQAEREAVQQTKKDTA